MNQTIYYDKDRRRLVDADGNITNTLAEIAYPQKPAFRLHVVNRDNQPVDLSEIKSARAAIANDFDSTTDPMSRSNTVGGTIDLSQTANGLLIIQNDADNNPFYTVVNGAADGEKIVWFEFAGFDNADIESFYVRFRVKAIMPLDPQGATLPPPEPQTQWADKAWVATNFEKVRTVIHENIDLKAATATNIFTVPSGRKFILKQVFLLCQEMTGSGSQPQFQIRHKPAGGGSNIILESATEHGAVNDISEDRASYNKAIPAGDSMDINISSPSTFTTHIATLIIEGVMIE